MHQTQNSANFQQLGNTLLPVAKLKAMVKKRRSRKKS
jgi:hypothetical protein